MYFPVRFSTRNFFALLFVSLLLFSNAFAQDTDDEIRVNTNLIQTRVVVVDKNNRFVEGLKPEQFELKVDGKPTKIEFFENINAYRTTEQSKESTEQKPSAIGTLRERQVIFFVDDLHLSLDSLSRTRSTINHFIDYDMLPTDNVAIISASGQIGFLQQFTDNKAVLRAALARLKVITDTFKDTDSPPMPPYVAVRIANGDRDAAKNYVIKIMEGMKARTGSGVSTSVNENAIYETVKQRATNIARGMSAVAEGSIGSLENLLLLLNQNGGRKLIYFISDGFYLESRTGNAIENNRMQRVVTLATRSGSVIYTIDARGLFSFATDATGERPVDSSAAVKSRLSEDTAAQDGLFSLAEETGGRFLKNTNYFDKWIDKTLDENSSYYTLAWNPDREDSTAKKFKKIEVSVVGRDDLSVRLQRGYLTNWENEKIADKDKENKNKKNAAKDSPTINTAAVSAGDGKEQKSKGVLPTLLSLSYLDVPNVGGVLTSSVQIATGGLKYGETGNQPAQIDLAGVIFNTEGKKVADFKTGLTVAPTKSVSSGETAQQQSVIYNNPTPIAPGLYQVRVGARENLTGKIGTIARWIEIPDLSKKQLTLGSLLLNAQTIKKSDKSADSQVQYSVDHKFGRPLNLSFLSFVYNAARADGGAGAVNLTSRIEVIDASGRSIIDTAARPLVPQQEKLDYSRIPVNAAIRQGTFAPGKYLLRLTVADLIAKTSSVQEVVFVVE